MIEVKHNYFFLLITLLGGLVLTYQEARSTNFDSLVLAGKIEVPNTPSHTAQPANINNAMISNTPDPRIDVLEKKLDMILSLLSTSATPIVPTQPALAPSSTSSAFQAKVASFTRKTSNLASSSKTIVHRTASEVSNLSIPKPSSSAFLSSSSAFTFVCDNDPLANRALATLQKLLGDPKASWTCDEQRRAVVEVLRGTNDVMACLRTGLGKTMLVLLPALMEDRKITVVILPFKALITDYQRRLDSFHINYQVFETTQKFHINSSSRLILVSADKAQTSRWTSALHELNARTPVSRFIWDEAHVAFTSSNFRESMNDLTQLRQVPVPIILLSGTVPPKSESLLIEQFGLVPPVAIFRTSSNHPHLRFQLEESRPDTDQLFARVEDLCRQHLTQFSKQDRGLIFVRTLNLGQHLAQRLGYDFYNGGYQQSDSDRIGAYGRWIEGYQKIMICTNAFGAGNDYSSVRFVIHLGTPLEMIDYIQETSRGGRDFQPADCYILPNHKLDLSLPTNIAENHDHTGLFAMFHLLNGGKGGECLRMNITKFCNGDDGIRCDDDSENLQCSSCGKRKERARTYQKSYDAASFTRKSKLFAYFYSVQCVLIKFQIKSQTHVSSHLILVKSVKNLRTNLIRLQPLQSDRRTK